jgi:HAD superfamily hydrolase (TIGR01662 family)
VSSAGIAIPEPTFDVVIPTTGRATLLALLDGFDAFGALGLPAAPTRVVVVDDRPDPTEALPLLASWASTPGHVVRHSGGRGPAAARNLGWWDTGADWVVFIDDDVRLPAGWPARLLADLRAAHPRVGGVQGRVRVPLPVGRRPTDWERSVAGLASARWVTADMAYRRSALAAVGGFDERFPRAYREDADLAARVRAAGFTLALGAREVDHPVRRAGPWVSVRRQAGNADDALLRARYGRRWRVVVGAGPGRMGRHLATTAALAAGALATATRRRRLAVAALGAWVVLTAELLTARVRPGPRTAREVATMATTSLVIPGAAIARRVQGIAATWRAHVRGIPPTAVRGTRAGAVAAVLFDRDGTLVVDVPYNGDPRRVRPVPGARDAVARLRAAGLRVGVVTNQSGVARGMLTEGSVRAVNRRVDRLLGPFDVWLYCPHGETDACACRKPAPGMVHRAAELLRVPVERCVVIGDTGADVEAARGAGTTAVLVPNDRTRAEEVRDAPLVAVDLAHAADLVLAR